MGRNVVLLAWCGALASGACAQSSPRGGGWVRTASLGDGLPAFRGQPSRRGTPPRPKGTVRLGQALAAVLWHNPRLRALAWEVRAKEAERLQAALLPNPEVSLETEDLGANGRLLGVAEMEVTLVFSQLVFLGGDRMRHRRLADLSARQAMWEHEVRRLDVLTEATRRFVDVLAAQRLVELADRQLRLMGEMARLLEAGAAAGSLARRDPGILALRVRLARLELERERKRRELAAAKARLAELWGGRAADVVRVVGRLPSGVDLPDEERLKTLARESVRLQVRAHRIRVAQAAVRFEEARGVPDLTITGGLRVLPADGSVGFVAGVSIPLPVFDRNQGNVAAARLRVRRAEALLAAARNSIEARLAELLERARQANEALRRLRGSLVPSARMALDAASEAYKAGKVDYLAVLDAQAALLRLQVEEIELKRRMAKTFAEMESLVGRPLSGKAMSRAGSR